MATTTEIRTLIANATTLDELCAVLNSYKPEFGDEPKLEDAVDLTSLPTFGGDVPEDTSEIWSWDATRYLVVDVNGAWGMITREDW